MRFKMLNQLTDRMFEEDDSGGIRERYEDTDVRTLHPLVSAYIGDAYFHLFVRTRLLSYEQAKVQVLNRFSAQIVSATWQAHAYRAIEPMLTEVERDIFRRGRNAHSHAPRVASVGDYHISTGFESLLGTLYLAGDFERLLEIAEASFLAIARQMMETKQQEHR